MKRILVPTDLSEEANCALKVAEYIALKTGAEIILFNVIELALPVSYYNTHQLGISNLPLQLDKTEQILALSEMKERLVQIEKQLKLKCIKCRSEVDLDVDDVFKDISDIIANRQNVDLIIMGSKGSSGLNELLIGSNTEKVVRKAFLPVLTVKSTYEDFKINKIVFSTDFEELSSLSFYKLKIFLDAFNAHLCLLYVNTKPYLTSNSEVNVKFEDMISTYQLTNYSTHIFEDVSEEKGIINFSNSIGADIIIMPTNGRSGLSKLIHGSVTSDVVNHSMIPILSIKMLLK